MSPETKATWIKWTKILLVGTMFTWFAYEIVVLLLGAKSALISPVILSFTQDRPQFIAFIFYLLGHLTWPQTYKQ